MACGNCGVCGLSLLTCARCHLVQYCDKRCQARHWKEGGHKAMCQAIREVEVRVEVEKSERIVILRTHLVRGNVVGMKRCLRESDAQIMDEVKLLVDLCC